MMIVLHAQRILSFEGSTGLRRKFPRHSILTDVNSYLHAAESIDDALLKIITEANRTLFPQEKVSYDYIANQVIMPSLIANSCYITSCNLFRLMPLCLSYWLGVHTLMPGMSRVTLHSIWQQGWVILS